MITNFETITYDLTNKEMAMLPIIIRGLENHVGQDNAITGKDICAKVDGLSEPRLRKIVNFIRSNSMLPVIATSKGYYTASNREELLDQIKSLDDRINAICSARDGLMKFI